MKFFRSPLSLPLFALVMSILVLTMGLWQGCDTMQKASHTAAIEQAKAPEKAPTPAAVSDGQKEVGDTGKAIAGASGTVGGMTPANLPDSKPKAMAQLGEAAAHNASAADDLAKAHKSSVEDVKEKGNLGKQVEALTEDDPLLGALRWLAITSVVAGLACVLGSFFLMAWVPLALQPHLRALGWFLLTLGLAATVLTRMIPKIVLVGEILGYVSLGAALIWAIAYAIRNRRIIFNLVESQAKAVQHEVSAAVFHTPETAHVVAAVQAKIPVALPLDPDPAPAEVLTESPAVPTAP